MGKSINVLIIVGVGLGACFKPPIEEKRNDVDAAPDGVIEPDVSEDDGDSTSMGDALDVAGDGRDVSSSGDATGDVSFGTDTFSDTEAVGCGAGCELLDDVCAVGLCVDGTCVSAPVRAGEACDDGLACTVGDVCVDGACRGSPAVCDDRVECTNDRCDESVGGCVADDSACECSRDEHCVDVDLCDGRLHCSPERRCVSGPAVVCAGELPQCMAWRCASLTGACEQVPSGQAEPCNDDDWCTVDDVCLVDGACTGRRRGGPEVVVSAPESGLLTIRGVIEGQKFYRLSWLSQLGYEFVGGQKDPWPAEAHAALCLVRADVDGAETTTRVLGGAPSMEGVNNVSVEVAADFVALRFRADGGYRGVDVPTRALEVDIGLMPCSEPVVLLMLAPDLSYRWHALACGAGGLAVKAGYRVGAVRGAEACWSLTAFDEAGVVVRTSAGVTQSLVGRGTKVIRYQASAFSSGLTHLALVEGGMSDVGGCVVADEGRVLLSAAGESLALGSGTSIALGGPRGILISAGDESTEFITTPNTPQACDVMSGRVVCALEGAGTLEDAMGDPLAAWTSRNAVLQFEAARMDEVTVWEVSGLPSIASPGVGFAGADRVVLHLQSRGAVNVAATAGNHTFTPAQGDGALLLQTNLIGEVITADWIVTHRALGESEMALYQVSAMRAGARGEPIRFAFTTMSTEPMQVGIEDPVPVQFDGTSGQSLLVMATVNVEGGLECREVAGP